MLSQKLNLKQRISILVVLAIIFGTAFWVRQKMQLTPADARFLAPSSNLEFVPEDQVATDFKQLIKGMGIEWIGSPAITSPIYVKKPVLRKHIFDIKPEKVWTIDRGTAKASFQVPIALAENTPTSLSQLGWQDRTAKPSPKTLGEAATEQQRALDSIARAAAAPACLQDPECQQRQEKFAQELNNKQLALYFSFSKSPYELTISVSGNQGDEKAYLEVLMKYTCISGITCSSVLLNN